MGFYVTGNASLPRYEAGCECREKTDPPSKNRVWDFFAASHSCAGQNATFTQYPRPENRPTPTATVSGARYYGYRFYSPSLGRWISRDPFGENGGPNQYGFVRNSVFDLIDPLGLMWKVTRDYQSTADAEGDCDDTVDELAKIIRLDSSEFKKWLTVADGKSLPTSSSDKMLEPRKFKIPNEAHFTMGDTDTVEVFLAGRRDDLISIYKDKGHKYSIVDHGSVSAGDARSIVMDSKNIYIWAHYGHGGGAGTGGKLIFEVSGYMAGTTAVGSGDFTPHHKLAEVVLYSCWAGVDRAGWRNKLVSSLGDLWATDAAISPLPIFGYNPFNPFSPLRK